MATRHGNTTNIRAFMNHSILSGKRTCGMGDCPSAQEVARKRARRSQVRSCSSSGYGLPSARPIQSCSSLLKSRRQTCRMGWWDGSRSGFVRRRCGAGRPQVPECASLARGILNTVRARRLSALAHDRCAHATAFNSRKSRIWLLFDSLRSNRTSYVANHCSGRVTTKSKTCSPVWLLQ